MPSRIDYLIRKLDDLEDAIRCEKREYDKARDRYDKMRSRDILEDLKRQLLGYQTEHDQLQRARSAREKPRPNRLPPRQQHPQEHPTHSSKAHQGQQQMPPPPQYRTTFPHRPAPQQNGACPPPNNHGPSGKGAGQTRGQPDHKNRYHRTAAPRPHQKTQTLDYEVEEPDGKTYTVKGGAVFRDFDPARDKTRRTE